MLANRKAGQDSFKYVRILTSYNLVSRTKGLPSAAIAFLSACLLINIQTNDFASLQAIRAMIGKDLANWSMIQRLINLGLMECPGYGLYIVTSDGEYLIRDLETALTRIVENKPFSLWRKITSPDDPRLKWVRHKRVNGSSEVRNPKDVRMIAKRVKAGLVAVWQEPVKKSSGAPDPINDVPGVSPLPDPKPE